MLQKANFRFLFLSIILIYTFYTSCKSQKINTSQNKKEEKTAFYEFNFRYDSIAKKSIISLKGIKIADVKLNPAINLSNPKFLSSIAIEIIDIENNHIFGIAEHPLFKKIDVFSESGEIEAKIVSLFEADLIIRAPYYKPYKKIKITETINNNKTYITFIKNENKTSYPH
jgi:hypothetical protein